MQARDVSTCPATHPVKRRATCLGLCLALVAGCPDDGAPAADDTSSSEGESSATTTSPTTSATTSESSSTEPAESSSSEASTAVDDSSSSGADESSSTGADTIAVTISFAATIGGEPFACGTTYTDVGATGAEVEPRDLRFFVHGLQLVRTDDDTLVPVELDEMDPWQAENIALVDFEDGSGACADGGGNPATHTEITGTVPAGDYDGLVFTVGVPEELNHADPLFAPSPLGATSMTWGWLLGYIFFKVEVIEVNGEGKAPGLGLLHVGSTGCEGMPSAGDVTCTQQNRPEVTLDGFDPTIDVVTLDVGALFGETDFTAQNTCHSFPNDVCPTLFEHLGLDFETGLPAAGQVVFSGG